ncbi:histone-lysine N-methyltransferase EHMT1-like [Lytechinus variegatus]|uniref:histone-lysine N-methyltransferase EHMT1-like n=1 Tax=Lytechinus variegatus TaxID=7654 RepID=UPI001BB1E55A|nr:histone-lysine N-methyltransferase EHMT1-like [Lytechinus variegatus]
MQNGHLLPDFNSQEPPMILECNSACKCWRNCRNRFIQYGFRIEIQMFSLVLQWDEFSDVGCRMFFEALFYMKLS